ncbi:MULTISPECIES: ABC transporter ATP-binding protein [unclassified Chelatococcus]|uniref:ABC transporter ATP-binding protein n=1 Tax=unclassified Chelatococcus TaxID=2638111 RepID=UPI001BCCDFAE|nr:MULTISPECIES: ABC transporter ATP-binding protein [unclassified Chelatococcus]MBS7700833.1 ABC transporter ATP-binding protein [Chelatococcus sp. YT9]MBX3555366.1 ABC transporter ATP-binding protein [Chelatococcus sp.]
MAQVALKNIVARYGSFLALDHVSLTIDSGQFVTLLGPSGCGKSSTLRIVAGLLEPDEGVVEFNGRDVTTVSSAKRNIGMVFQSLALFPHMTVSQNVAFGLRMKKMPQTDIEKQVRRMLQIVRLDHLADRYPAQMSGGQQQRVALARALAITPSILILDEPFGALDRKLREAMQVELHALTRQLGITALFVTHDQEEALMLSDSIAVMNKGHVEQFGSPAEIYRSPRTQFVADFMGMTNFLPAEVLDADAGSAKVRVGSAVFSTAVKDKVTPGESVKLAIRPEKVMLGPMSAADRSFLEGSVRQVTYHGNASRYVVELPEGGSIIALQQHAEAADLPVGTSVQAYWRPEDIHVFRE